VRTSVVALALVALSAAPTLAQDQEKELEAKVEELVAHADDADHARHAAICSWIFDFQNKAGTSSYAIPLAPFLACMKHADTACRQASFEVFGKELNRKEDWIKGRKEEVLRALVHVASMQPYHPAKGALFWLNRIDVNDRDRDAWVAWLEAKGEKVELLEVIAAVATVSVERPISRSDAPPGEATVTIAVKETRTGMNGQPVDDVEGAVNALALLAARAGLRFERRQGAEAVYPVLTRLLRPVSLDERRAEAARLDGAFVRALDGSHLDEAADLLLDRASLARRVELNTVDEGFPGLARELHATQDALARRLAGAKLKASIVVTAILIDPRRGNAAIVVLSEDGSEGHAAWGRIYAEGDELRDRDDRIIPGFKVVKIQEGGVRLSLEGEELVRELKSSDVK
jgi:hypothetical protein